jgi:hypothetical protein
MYYCDCRVNLFLAGIIRCNTGDMIIGRHCLFTYRVRHGRWERRTGKGVVGKDIRDSNVTRCGRINRRFWFLIMSVCILSLSLHVYVAVRFSVR